MKVYILSWHNSRLNDSGVYGAYSKSENARGAANNEHNIDSADHETLTWTPDSDHMGWMRSVPPTSDVAWFISTRIIDEDV